MSARDYDAIVIGTGPAGEGAAMQLVKGGKRVAVVERYRDPGGGCTHWATIPSKALRHAIQVLEDYRNNPLFQRTLGRVEITYPQLLKAAESVITDQVKVRGGFYHRNRVDVLHGHARFVDPHTVEVAAKGGPAERYSAGYFVIGAGSRPYHPPDVDFEHPRVLDSDSVLQLERTPRSIAIYGAGVIGCEYASIFGHLHMKVDLVNTRKRLLEFLDDEITDALSYHLRDLGVVIRHGEEYEKVEPGDDGVVLYLRSGKRIKSDVLLWANGRSGNTQDLGVDALGLAINHRGQIEINEKYQTNLPHMYAAGDVVGFPSLASAGYDQGRFAGANILNKGEPKLIQDMPIGIYTSPEISSLGRTERELTEQRIPYEVGRAMFRSLARAQITGHTVGMLKLLFHRETLELLGIHCFGEQASEIVHIGQAIMAQEGEANSLEYFIDTTFNYPTMAEAYRVAALNGYNRIF
ncbi:MAG: Si-specific NAD(P)(+) transhydrogenase [Gammaproteobacteria bacterium]|nr:Si-specific NAD(P)(+) transhydrogenase [Gammaproteobacteria bacterium]NIR85814.1 Si-specific NAD(P)(+) transhydrogenase [Gammaproteobacteria bacterium]NIR90568.1 Si-specific NAD(P)(+) transhydrogenase [Gammaproteobacteria bacterium]NIU06949.1 Si-specific NAD(P)(+) transhydrogenase [Gammaproteobacteria bacterium]NIV53879.1 Si-specific NAD(P)(+) transhydrogenase [Gammaproteobacteria bacterium]